MSRNIDKAIELVFDIVKLRFVPIGPTDYNEPRYIDGSKDDKSWLVHSKIKEYLKISSEKFFAIVEYDNLNYFVSVGYKNPVNLPHGLVQHPLNAGLFTAIVSELELPIKNDVSNLKLEENVLSQNAEEALYKGHNFNELKIYFPNICISEITQQFIGDSENLYQLVCVYLTVNSFMIPLPFSQVTLGKINELVLVNSKILSYESVMQALLSSHFKFSFLDLYRCIELLYQIVYIDDAHANLKLTIKRSDFLNAIDSNLKWKPRETDSIFKIFADTPEYYKKDLEKTIKTIKKDSGESSKWVYELRCSIVHLKSMHKTFDIKQEQWDSVISGICDILKYWYGKYPTFD